MGGVAYGSPLSSSNTNSAFLEKNGDDATVGRVGLLNTLTQSGSSIINLQASINGLAYFLGCSSNPFYNQSPSWINNDWGLLTDSVKLRADKLTERFNGVSGHFHSGTDGDGPQLSLSSFSGVLPISQGGTSATTASAAFNNLSPAIAKGDLITNNGSSDVRLPVGANGLVLTADSTQTDGIKWATPVTTGPTYNFKTITASAYFVQSTDDVLICDSSSNNIQINLLAASGNLKPLLITKKSSDSNTVLIAASGSDTIIHNPTQTIYLQDTTVQLWSDQVTNYFVN